MNRILNVLKWDITTHKRTYMWQAASYLGVLFVIMLMPMMVNGADYGHSYFAHEVISFINTLTFLLYLTLLSAPYDGKQRRISMLMLPATMREKLAARLLFVLVVVPVSLLLLTVVADIASMLLAMLLTVSAKPLHDSYTLTTLHEIYAFLRDVFRTYDDSWMGVEFIAFNIAHRLFFLIFPLMCGALWTRKALLKSIVLGVVVLAVNLFLTGFAGFFGVMLLNFNCVIESPSGFSPIFFVTTVTLCIYAIDALMLYIGYRAFVRRQL